MRKTKLLVFKFEEPIGSFDSNEIKKVLEEVARKTGIEFVLLPHWLNPVSQEDLKKFISELKELVE